MGERFTCCLCEERVVRGGVMGTETDGVSAGICKKVEGDTVHERDGGVVHLEMSVPDGASERVTSCF